MTEGTMAVQFTDREITLNISDYGEGTVRVRACLGADKPAFRSFAVLPERKERAFAACGDTLRTEDGLTVAVAEDLSLSVLDSRGRVVHRDVPGRAFRRDAMGRFVHTFAVDGYWHIYGLGERAGQLNRFGQSYRLDLRDAIGYDAASTDPLYKQIPFIIRRDVKGRLWCGLFYDAVCGGEVDLGRERSGYWPRYCKVSLCSDQIDLYIITGDSMTQIIRRYARLTGAAAMPPLATMGHMASTMYLTEVDRDADKAITAYIDELHRRGFGCDGYHMSSGYTTTDGKRCVFQWNSQRFPDPDAFCRSLTDRGLLLSPNIKPAMLTVHPLYDEFARAGAFLTDKRTGQPYLTRYWGGMASFVDLLSEPGQRLWSRYLRQRLLDRGVNALWDDNNEYELDDNRAATAGDERPACALRPAFSNEMARLSVEAIRASLPGTRPYVLSRSGYAGIQRYAQTWAGDNRSEWSALKYNIPIMLGMSVSGVANQGCDIGGFAGPAPDGELFVRWVQNGVFQPRFCLHSCNDDNTITQPWAYEEEYTAYVREAFRLRYSLALYLYSLMWRAHREGDPIMRPMAYDFDDPALADESFDFMFGPSLLVASVVEQGAVTRSVYLPAGCDWIEWDTGVRHAGGQRITVEAPLSRIPLFRRSGSIIPLVESRLQLDPSVFEHVTLLAEASSAAGFTLYQDDGRTTAYEQGVCLETRIDMAPEEEEICFAFRSQGSFDDRIRRYDVRLTGRFIAPLAVRVEQEALRQCMSREAFEAAQEDCWYFSLLNREVCIRFRNPARDFDLHIDYRLHDLIGM